MEKYKTNWDLTLLYKGPNDPQIEKDMRSIEKACTDFEKKYKNGSFIKNPSALLKALEDNKKVSDISNGGRPVVYYFFLTQLNTEDAKARAQLTLLEQRLTIASNKLTFFGLEIAKIKKTDQKIFLSFKPLALYKYMLEKIFQSAKYNLSEKEEQLESLLSQPAFMMWVDANEKLMNQQKVLYKGKEIPLSEAESLLAGLPESDRQKLYKEIVASYKKCEHISESEINAIYTYKKLMDERRGYSASYTQTLDAQEIDEKTALNLISTTTKFFSISKKFYKLHAKLLKKEKLSYADRSAPIGKIKKQFSFDSAVKLVSESFVVADKKYSDLLQTFLNRGQIDAFPKLSKTSGGYCAPSFNNPTFVLLNHTDDLRSVETLAHEMGHAIHSDLSSKQLSQYQELSMSTAEVASTFFEQILNSNLEKSISDSERLILLHGRVLRDVTTIFRQIACFNFEKELHEIIKSKGHIASAEISQLLVKHLNSYIGESMSLTQEDGLQYVGWSHIRRFFYVFSYAYGLLVSKSLFEKWKADPSYIKQIENFLSAGSSMSPKDIFKKIGIDTSDPKFFEAGLKAIDRDITKLEKLAKKTGFIK